MLTLKGMAMGIAEAIPGVSGGTLAFITGIYEELLWTIKSINPGNLKLILSDRAAFWKAINGPFLLWLLFGMAGGLILGVLVISHMLETNKEILWALFFGLVLASAVLLGKDVEWDRKSILMAVVGAAFAYAVTMFSPVTGSTNPVYLFLSGMLAVSALMLPGVSGSFILLLLGLYDSIINGLKAIIAEQDFSALGTLVFFGLGVLIGLFTFAKVLSWLFAKFRNPTMAVMIGILIGSLNKLWPWKLIETAMDKTTGNVETIGSTILPTHTEWKILTETNLLPMTYQNYTDPKLLLCIVALVLGAFLVLMLSRLDSRA
ncbi:MAG: DUF368 domain-containing protein [Bacteroidota bacterium]